MIFDKLNIKSCGRHVNAHLVQFRSKKRGLLSQTEVQVFFGFEVTSGTPTWHLHTRLCKIE